MAADPVAMELDVEWLALIHQARELGLTMEEIREYLGIEGKSG